jgi:adenylate cyclase
MRVIASSTQVSENDESELKRIPVIEQIADLNSQLPRQALLALPNSQFKGGFKFNTQEDGLSYMASLSDTRIKVATDWRVLVIAPSKDFLIGISYNNRLIAAIGSLTIVIQLLMIYWLARRIAQPLELLAHQVDNIQQLKFVHDQPLQRSSFSEIDHLSVSIDRMQKAIGAFAAFVPVDLVRGLMNSGKQLELGGRSRFLTIMFCDLESFSTLSESSPSQELLLRVSKYFEISTNAINEEFGTVDKFIGDGVMAFWGAPNTLDDHAYRACSAALKIQDQMHLMNQIWEGQGLSPLKVRIGIHSDAVLVGNIGSLKRMSYTVMGDGVNVAARLEGINKELGTQICISKAVYREAGEKLNVRSMNEVTVKGRKSMIEVYELLGLKNSNLN